MWRLSIVSLYKEIFGQAPAITARASGRVNIIGEHVDYNGGTVFPAAIDRYVQAGLSPNSGREHRIASARFSGVDKRIPGQPKNGSWSDYAAGALEKATELGLLNGPVCLALESNIPDGAGLSSSSALVAAVLRGCCALSGKTLDPVDLAMASRAVENDYIGMPCGIMDQMAIALTTPRQALALDTAKVSFDLVDIPDVFSFVILHSGVHRKLSDGRYKVRFEECEAARVALGAEFLCLLDEAQAAKIPLLEDTLAARARHVVSEHKRTLAAIEAMRAGEVAEMGRLMNASHVSYREDFAASTPEIDALVETCTQKGAYGARLTGGGFGGCVVCLVGSGAEDRWVSAVLEAHPDAQRIV